MDLGLLTKPCTDRINNYELASAAAYTAAAEATRKDPAQAILTSCGSLGPPASAEGGPTAMDDDANVASKKHQVRACGGALGSRLIRHSAAQRARHACVGHAVRAQCVGAPESNKTKSLKTIKCAEMPHTPSDQKFFSLGDCRSIAPHRCVEFS